MRPYLFCKHPKAAHGGKPASCPPFYKVLLEIPHTILVNSREEFRPVVGPPPMEEATQQPKALQRPTSTTGTSAEAAAELVYEGSRERDGVFRSEVVMKRREGSNSTVWLKNGTSGDMLNQAFFSKSFPLSEPDALKRIFNEVSSIMTTGSVQG